MSDVPADTPEEVKRAHLIHFQQLSERLEAEVADLKARLAKAEADKKALKSECERLAADGNWIRRRLIDMARRVARAKVLAPLESEARLEEERAQEDIEADHPELRDESDPLPF